MHISIALKEVFCKKMLSILTYLEPQGIMKIHRDSRYFANGGIEMINDKGLLSGTTMLLLLSLLSEKDCYGYEIIKELREKSEDVFQFKEGTLYPVLHKMEADGYVKSYRKEADNGKLRTYYKITGLGEEQLATEKEKWNEYARGVAKVAGGTAYAF